MGDSYMLIAVSVLASVSSSYGSQDQVMTTSFGKTATLQCPIANLGSDLQSLYWRKDETIIYSLTSKRGNGKYSVTATASLVIPDVTESDAGNYFCIVAFRKSSGTIKSDIMQLYVIDISVSDCKDTGQEVDGCSCNINGSNITSLECSASGFPHPPVITWEEEDPVIYQSSSINVTRFRENITLTCKARDDNLNGAVANKTVCVYYEREVTSTGGSPEETTTASVNVRACIAVIVVLSVALILVLLERYLHQNGKACQFPTSIMCTSMPKTLEEPDEPPLHGKDIGANDAGRVEYVLKDASNWKNSKESSVEDLPTSQPGIESIEGGTGDAGFPPEDCNQNVVVGDEQQLSLAGVGLVLLDDLRSAPEETKESIKAAAVALIVDLYKIHQSHVDPRVTIHSLLINMNETLQRSVNTGDLGNPDAEFNLDRIIDERDRDECEVLIPEPESQEVTDESQIPAYQGSSAIQQSIPVSAMSNIVVLFNPQPSLLRGELQAWQGGAVSDATFRIIQDGLVTGNSGLRGNSFVIAVTDMLPPLPMQSDMMSSVASSVVAFNQLSPALREELFREVSERTARYNAFSQSILDLLQTGHSGSSDSSNFSTAFVLGTVSVPVEQTLHEEDEIQEPPSTAKLLEDRCRAGEESNNEHHDYMNT